MGQVLVWDLALTLCSSSSTCLVLIPFLVLHLEVCWARADTRQLSGFPVSLAWLPGKQLIYYLLPTVPLKTHQGTSGNCTSHLQGSREGKNYIFVLYFLIFSFFQHYSGSQVFGAICGEKTLHVVMDFHFPDS